MTRYKDDRGRLFRWDEGLRVWYRIVSWDDEYDDASRATLPTDHGATVTAPAGGPARTAR